MNKPETPQAPQPAGARTSSKGSAWKWGVAILFLAAAAGIYYFYPPKQATTTAGAGGMGGRSGGGGAGGMRGGRFGGGGPTPVSTALAEKGELRIYLTALGSATALNTITVKSRA